MKKIFMMLLWLCGSTAMAQSIANQSPSLVGVDGSNVTAAKVVVYPQVQSTPGTTPTPQTSNWYQLNGNGAIQVEFSGNTFAGSYSVQVSNNPTPVSTPGTNIYTVVRDKSTYLSGGSETQTLNWSYIISAGWRYIRFLATPESGNAGTLNIQTRVFGNPTTGDAQRTYQEGIPWKDSYLVNDKTAQGAATFYQDFKVPSTATGFILAQNVSAVSGASTITSTVMTKDPVSGQVQSLGALAATTAAGYTTLCIAPGQ